MEPALWSVSLFVYLSVCLSLSLFVWYLDKDVQRIYNGCAELSTFKNENAWDSPPLPFHSPFPLPPLKSWALWIQLGVWGSAVSSPAQLDFYIMSELKMANGGNNF